MDYSLIIIVVITALAFDFTNGFHDTANAMATSIATGALRPKFAVGLSAVLNLVGAFLSVEVARTISSGIVAERVVTPNVVFGALVGAILWNLVTWYFGLPSSSSHALFGGLIGAAWVAAGTGAVHFGAIVEKILLPALAAPIVAGLATVCGTALVYRMTRGVSGNVRTRGYRWGQIASASLVSLAHGTNDAQKTMGVITLTLVSMNALPTGAAPPTWVIVSAGAAIALGTYLGGWRIIKTVGTDVTDIEAPQGFVAQTGSTAVILASAHLGFALSTTHVVSGGIVGSGVARGARAVRWGIVGRMVAAWAITLPAAALVGALAGYVAELGTGGFIAVGLVGLAIAILLFVLARRSKVGADTFAKDSMTRTKSKSKSKKDDKDMPLAA
ncbi:inorganic phosphate transporter [Sciscionella sediminilitoris]|uniref:inorganic phosphate transporter n=1 Tax=Sciscionella sediminilitoris TaxID=1445613 RepID=UPI00055BE905|nr:inorganic phosphate transporter [Sciscionella sp. SE31]